MTWRRAAWIAGALAVAWFLWGWGVPFVVDFAGRGRRLTHTTINDNLSVDEPPQALAAAAAELLGRPVDVDAYAAARMVRSEEGDASDLTKALLVHVAMNDAQRKTGGDLLRVLTLSSVASRNGKFGKQTSRRYSTRSDPYERDLLIAEEAIGEWRSGLDRSGGAVKFYHRQPLEIVGVASYEDIVASWGREGLQPFEIDGAPIGLVFFRPGVA